jgi:hypothetical protein
VKKRSNDDNDNTDVQDESFWPPDGTGRAGHVGRVYTIRPRQSTPVNEVPAVVAGDLRVELDTADLERACARPKSALARPS